MFSLLVVLPTASFLVLGYYVSYVIKYVTADVLHAVLRSTTQDIQIINARAIFHSQYCDITDEVRTALKCAKLETPGALQHTLELQRDWSPEFIAVDYSRGARSYTYYYPRGKNLVFPPCTNRSMCPIEQQASKAYLVLHEIVGDSFYKQVRQDVTHLVQPLLGPGGDWFGNTQHQPVIVFNHLVETIEDIVEREVSGLPGYLKLTFKFQGRKLSLTKLLADYGVSR